ncbi:hypothetical protein ASG31_04360 [Chryseobacterium sp. Leaf404]|uniref:hypothetical protein n=1 Tax=unclassified Chryseobacterium TaxID=2593645 RepID=UPI0006F248D0|nr:MULTISPECIES: hypothetical protein [unclassified Chryseobacterium]KQT17976.1 hypothetical protein ASG31_04360 [Chryseobacterium sp. Leaf404]
MEIREQNLEPDSFYHIYNKGVNGERTFLSDENYRFFLSKVKLFLSPVCDIYAYSLMPNYFDLLVKIKSEDEFPDELKIKNFHTTGLHSYDSVISKQFSKLISSYSQAFNRFNKVRTGNLFESHFKRLKIESEENLRNTVVSIHKNSLKISADYENYTYSSYKDILLNENFTVKANLVITIFGDLENFKLNHSK